MRIVKIHFLGTTGYHPNNHRQTACVMIPEVGIIFDAGTGIFRARDLIQTKTLRIFLSHVHLDHSIGITFLFDILHERDVDQVLVYSETEKIEALRQHLFAEPLFPVMPEFEFVAYDGNDIVVDDLSIKTFPLKHPGGSVGFRVDAADKSMAYVTDTTAEPDADYINYIRDVDLLIHECYFPDGWEERAELTGHSCLSPVCNVAKTASAGQLYLVHINPLDEDDSMLDLEAGRKIFNDLTVARDQMVIDW